MAEVVNIHISLSFTIQILMNGISFKTSVLTVHLHGQQAKQVIERYL